MKLYFIFLGILKWNQAAFSGEQSVTTHDYEGQKKDLDGSPTKCGVGGTGVDVTRLTAVEGLGDCDCFKCITVTSKLNGKIFNVMAVDIGGAGLDISLTAYRTLSGQTQPGHVDVKWTEADPSACQGILPNQGKFSLSELTKKLSCKANQSYNEIKDNDLPSNENQPEPIQITPDSQNNQSGNIQSPTETKNDQPGAVQPPPETQNIQPGIPSNQPNSPYQLNQMNSYNPNQYNLLDNSNQFNPIDNSIDNYYQASSVNSFPPSQQYYSPFGY